jgi:hypothetical protein
MAMIVAAAAEYKWLVSLGIDSKFIKGARYVDDGVVFFDALNLSKPIAYYRDLLITGAYPPSLELEITNEGNVSQILETEISINAATVSIRHFNKNAAFVLLGKQQKIRKFLPWSSAHPSTIYKNVILGLLHRMCFNTSSSSICELITPWKSYLIEMRDLGYPSRIIMAAVNIFLCHFRIQPFIEVWFKILVMPLRSVFKRSGE